MNVITPLGQDEWKNGEVTGYVKVIDTASNDDASPEVRLIGMPGAGGIAIVCLVKGLH